MRARCGVMPPPPPVNACTGVLALLQMVPIVSDVGRASTPPRLRRRLRAGHRVLPSVFATVAVAVSVVLLSPRAGADPVSNSENQLNQISGQLQGAQAQAALIEGQLQVEGAQLDELAQQYETAEQQVQSLDAQLTTIKAQVARTENQVAVTEGLLRNEALLSYMDGATDDQFDSIFTAPGVQAAETQEYQNLVGASLSNAVDALHVEQQALASQQNQVQSTETQARAVADQAAAAQSQAQSVAAQQQSDLNQVTGQVATLLAQQQQAEQQVAAAKYAQQQAAAEAAAEAASESAPNGVGVDVALSPGASGAVQAAESQLGVPYVWGGESPLGSSDPGFDCSGLVDWSLLQAGVSIPGVWLGSDGDHGATAEELYQAIPAVSMSDLQPGDLVFWDDGTTSVQHVGMYVGNGDVIDAPETGENVQIQPIWTNGLVGAGAP